MADFFNWEVTPLFTVSLIDIIDISLIAFAIYKITMWVRATRARTLFKGIIIILVIWGLSFLFRLTAISWLVSSFFNIGIIAMVIVFQPELRKVLEEIGRGKFAPHFQAGEEEEQTAQSAKHIVEAVESMVKVGTGALILIEQDVVLDEIEQTGVKLDALVSTQLLLNLFEHNAPLHDGAILIRKNRIAAASCILPLTETEIGKELGTRHRAAVGVSEVYNVLAIVVSEETSKISIALAGKLARNLSGEKLEKIILGGARATYKRRFAFFRPQK